jgi:hypothetical protein
MQQNSVRVRIVILFRGQTDWTLTHTGRKGTEQSTIKASITPDGVTLTELLLRWSPNEWPSLCRYIPVSADEMFCTSNESAKWTLYIHCLACSVDSYLFAFFLVLIVIELRWQCVQCWVQILFIIVDMHFGYQLLYRYILWLETRLNNSPVVSSSNISGWYRT